MKKLNLSNLSLAENNVLSIEEKKEISGGKCIAPPCAIGWTTCGCECCWVEGWQ